MSTAGVKQPALLDFPAEVETARLLLRGHRPGDGIELFQALEHSRDTLSTWVTWINAMTSVEDCEVYAQTIQAAFGARTELAWQIRLKDDNRLVGGISLHAIDWALPSYAMGWWVSSNHERRGYVKEAAEAISEIALTTGQAVRLWATCDVDNRASAAVMKHIGMKLEGVLRNHMLKPDGRLRDTALYAMYDAAE